jgi:hypothetical protein
MAVDYVKKVASVSDVSKEFLTIVVGLGLSYAIATRGPELNGIKEGTGTFTVWNAEVGALLVYVFYASRFFINNWLYLSDSYDDEALKILNLNNNGNIWRARKILARVTRWR